MLTDQTENIAQIGIHHTVEQTTVHASDQGAGGVDFIMHHILDTPLIKLPTLFGIDLSITKHVIMMWTAAALLIGAFTIAFRTRRLIPSGLANGLEAIVLYLRDDLIMPNLGHEGRRYAPYLLTAFFFILLCNLLGLVPFGATATGNISVTAGLAILTFVMVQISGIRKRGLWGYLKHFIPPGLPVFIIPIMLPVEIMSMFTKHFALAVRLFANMIAGHITIFALMSIIFLFKNWLITPFPLAIILFSSLLEILIALIQAYVFTILSAVFIGMSTVEDH